MLESPAAELWWSVSWAQLTLGRSSLGSFFLASMCTVLPFRVSSTASTTRSIWVTPAQVHVLSSLHTQLPKWIILGVRLDASCTSNNPCMYAAC